MDLKDAKALVEQALTEHELLHYRFRFDNATRRFGYCAVRKELISLSRKLTLLNSEEVVKDVILHEVAHALDYRRNGNIGHNKSWKDICVEIGCRPVRCYSESVIRPKAKYLKTCPNCGPRGTAQRQSKTIACGACCRKYNNNKFTEEYLLKYELNV